MSQPPGPRTSRMGTRRSRAAAGLVTALGLVLAGLAASSTPPAGATLRQGSIPAPVTTISPDGLAATDGTRTLAASQTQDISPSGATVTVTGSGYDPNKGIYVAFCLIPPTNQQPTPCGGGVDTTGASGSSQWISSNAPAYGEGLATLYGPGGTFSLDIAVSPQISPSIDCRRVRCAIVTRNDHTRTSDRGQDIFLPVTFGVATPDPADPDPDQPVETTTTTVPQALPAPEVALSDDGRVATAGTITVEVSQARDLDAEGLPVTVTGAGFDESKGIGVAFCVVGEPGQVPGPCADGSASAASATAWISSDPPEGGDAAVPYSPGGSFSLTLATTPVIAGTDCTSATCAIVTSNDSTRPEDRSQDIVIPVTFAAPVATTTTVIAEEEVAVVEEAAPEPDSGSSGSALPWIIAVVVVAAAGGGVAYYVVRTRNAAEPAAEQSAQHGDEPGSEP